MVKRSQQKSGFTTRTYKYGLVPLEPFPEQAVTELHKANDLRNKLVEFHKEGERNYEKLLGSSDSEYKKLKRKIDSKDKEIDNAYEEKRTARMKSRTTSSDDPLIKDANARIRELKQERSRLYEELKPVRERITETGEFKEQRKQLDRQFKEKCTNAVLVENTGVPDSPTGLDSRTANHVKNYFLTARDRFFKNRKQGQKSRLKFHRFDGTGYFYYRFPGKTEDGARKTKDGVPFDDLYSRGEDEQRPFHITPLKNDNSSKKKQRYELRVKLGGGAKKKNKLYFKFVLILHRPLPKDAQINNAQVLRRRTGNKFSYFVCFTVHEPVPDFLQTSETAIGIDLNWRRNKDRKTIEVATVAYEDESPAKVVSLPEEIIKKENYINDRKAELDTSAMELGGKIKNEMKKMKLKNSKREKLWKSVVNLPANRTLSYEVAFKVAGWAIHEPEVFPTNVRSLLSKWRIQYGRTYQECHNLRRKILAHRKDFYRQEATALIKQCKEIVLEDIDLSALAEYHDRDDTLSREARRNRFLAAPGEFRAVLKNAAQREGIPVTSVPAYNTSRKCSSCGEINKKLTSEKKWKCPSCGVLHDRDVNAAKNIVKLKKTT